MEMAETKGIKETLEVIDGVELLVVTGKKIFADGKVTFEDTKHLGEVIDKHQVLTEAIKDADQVVPEVKDLSTEELAIVGARFLTMIKNYKAA